MGAYLPQGTKECKDEAIWPYATNFIKNYKRIGEKSKTFFKYSVAKGAAFVVLYIWYTAFFKAEAGRAVRRRSSEKSFSPEKRSIDYERC